MSSHNTRRKWIARIAPFAMLWALVGGLWLVSKAAGGAGPFAAAASSCNGFAVAAHQSTDKGDAMVLSGTFAPGDQVHLAFDVEGPGSTSWEVTGVLARMAIPTDPGTFEITKA